MTSLEDWLAEIVMAVLLAMGGAQTRIYLWLRDVVKSHQEIREQQKHQDDLILENREMVREVVENGKDQTRAVKDMVHYMKWLAEQQTGKTPPPPSDP